MALDKLWQALNEYILDFRWPVIGRALFRWPDEQFMLMTLATSLGAGMHRR